MKKTQSPLLDAFMQFERQYHEICKRNPNPEAESALKALSDECKNQGKKPTDPTYFSIEIIKNDKGEIKNIKFISKSIESDNIIPSLNNTSATKEVSTWHLKI